jgi:tetratricopeptide (TPR) repeat protein
MESENEKTVPAIGTIMKHSESREYGFIKNAFGEDVFFHYNNIIEPDLRDQLKGEKQFLNIQVCYTESRNIKGKKAVSLHLPWKVSKCLEIADTLKCNGNYEEAADICKQILFAFPENVLAMKRLEALRPKRKYFAKAESSVEFLYLRGKKAKDNKDYVNAISLLKESIKKGEKLDSAVKDLASCYQELGDYESGISLIKDQITNLQKNDTTYNFVANFYSAAGLFELSNEYLDKILLNIPSSQKVPVLFRKSQNLLKLKSYDNALTIFEDVLSIDPENSFALKWRDQINKYKSDGDEEIVRPTDDLEFLTTLSGATTIILSDLKQCKYEGIPDEVVLKSEFKKEDLEKLRMRLKVLTNEGGSNLPSERAKWLLTEIKLVKDHQLDGEETLNALMSRYCIAKAQSYAINNDSEMIRTYYLELFKINKNMRYIVQPLLLSVLSFSKNWEWINNSKYTQGIDAARIKEFRATGLRDVIEIHNCHKKV